MIRPDSQPKVLLIASFDGALHGHAGLRRRALERLGCTVTSFDIAQPPNLIARIRGGSLQDRLHRALDQAAPELVLVIRGAAISAPMVASLKRETSAVWANWFPDDLSSLELILQAAVAYDHIFVAGTDVVAAVQGVGMPRAGYLPLACDPSIHRPMRSRDQFRANVVFVGRATPRRERLLSELVEFGLAIWGPGWRKTALHDYCRGELLTLTDYVRAYAGASVAVNIHHTSDEGLVVDRGCNQRVFELAAIGVPQVVDDRADLHRHFDPRREVLVYHGGTEMKELVKEVLHDPACAEQIATAARRRALAEHTYMHRMRDLLSVAGESR